MGRERKRALREEYDRRREDVDRHIQRRQGRR